MVHIYILQLENNKYYIGKTNNPSFRVNDHFTCNGSAWTSIHKPIKVLDLIPNCDDYDEDKYTQMYMDKHGINNVRGGSFVSITLNQTEMNMLQKKNNGTNDKCFKCGIPGHFVSNCLTTTKDMNEYLRLSNKIERKQNVLDELKNADFFGIRSNRIETVTNQITETDILLRHLESKYKTQPHQPSSPPIPTGRTWLSVSFAQKDEAKALGARFDSTEKRWYVPQGQDLTPLKKWL